MEVRFGIVGWIEIDDPHREARDKRSMRGWKNNQGIGGGVHAPPMVGSAVAPK